jgi:hypothetical protein
MGQSAEHDQAVDGVRASGRINLHHAQLSPSHAPWDADGVRSGAVRRPYGSNYPPQRQHWNGSWRLVTNLGAVDEDVPFDWVGADDLSAKLRSTATVLE